MYSLSDVYNAYCGWLIFEFYTNSIFFILAFFSWCYPCHDVLSFLHFFASFFPVFSSLLLSSLLLISFRDFSTLCPTIIFCSIFCFLTFSPFLSCSTTRYIENGSLSAVLKRFGSFSESLVAIYVTQILKGLQYLHHQGVVHRDIKGANILTTKDGA